VQKSDGERRSAERIEALVIVGLDEERYGVTRDVSERGLLIATRSRFTPGDRIEVTIHDTESSTRATARVVRVDEAPPEDSWRYRVALELDAPLTPRVIEHGTRAAAMLLRPSRPPPP
jgi:hypothetical protein